MTSDQLVLGSPLSVKGRGDMSGGKDRFLLRSKQQTISLLGIEQRFHADPVPGQEQPSPLPLPNGEGPDTVEPLQAAFSKSRVGMEQHLRIGMAKEAMAQTRQLLPKLSRIVKLPIIDDDILLPCPFQCHGLGTALRVHDGKATVKQCQPLFPVDSLTVWTSAGHRSKHLLQYFLIIIQIQYSGNGTQTRSLPFLLSIVCADKQNCPRWHKIKLVRISCYET